MRVMALMLATMVMSFCATFWHVAQQECHDMCGI